MRALIRDYRAFVSLGPGGTPSTLEGYLRVKFLSLFALRDPYQPAQIPPTLSPQTGCIKFLSQREGPRPHVRGIAPHRQINQKAPPAAFHALSHAIEDMALNSENCLRLGTSCLEKHGPGLFTANTPWHLTRNCSGEICHAHPSDGSLHLVLHPADAAVVLQTGWGERHPLAKGGWLSRFVPAGFIMVYAPRDMKEVEVVSKIIAAAVWWIGGVNVDGHAIETSKAAHEKLTPFANWDVKCGKAELKEKLVVPVRGALMEDCHMPGLVEKS
ncbi:hypothetical protein LTS18_002661 [Coniosporium uncinatum]|uniref:Uncharacterized protein n=1 Tax=Coniosporium uncinatum TaxID=93489 RepID=A0ACC3DUB7_9PEZI|nr:hypothetical protein LTS18_002661 [Coniosporium uncinatum]